MEAKVAEEYSTSILMLDLEDGIKVFLRNFNVHLQDYTIP
jgi:hypothetical protein